MDAAMYEVEEERHRLELELQQHFQAMQPQLPRHVVEDGGGALVGDASVGDGVASDGVEGTGPLLVDADAGRMGMIPPNQLTVSFQGRVFVFDSVSTEKVHSVLLFLGGQELPLKTVPFHQNHWVLDDVPRSSNDNHRHASLMRFREKRKDRCFKKKIRYHVRKEVAQRMQRKKGQFISSRAGPEDVSSTSTTSDPAQRSCLDGIQEEIFCQHCGCSQTSTPMMRRGPGGPKSLCNACGIMWASKGTLKDLLKAPTGIPFPSVN